MRFAARVNREMRAVRCIKVFWVVCLIFSVSAPLYLAEAADFRNLQSALRRVVPVSDGSAVLVSDVLTGERIFSSNPDTPLKPASVLKMLTAVAALEELGLGFQFETKVFGVGLKGSHIDKLYIRGMGDPSMTYESLADLSKALYVRGVRSIGSLVLDDNLFIGGVDRQGERAYQAGNAALPFNFNTLKFEVCANSDNVRVSVDPPEFPVELKGSISSHANKNSLFHITETASRGFDSWSNLNQPLKTFQLSGNRRVKDGCASFYRTVAHPTEYFAQVLAGLLIQKGVKLQSVPQRGVTPKGAAVIYTHYSKSLSEIVRDMNQYSNNFIAEQLLMALGRGPDGKFYRGDGLGVLTRFAQQLGDGNPNVQLQDGSGLSHQNKLPSEVFANLLLRAQKKEEYRVEFERSLAVDSLSGTLKKRSYPGVVRAKTGTINGVNGLAGYTKNKTGRTFAFVIIQNRVSSRAKASKLERDVLKVLYESTL